MTDRPDQPPIDSAKEKDAKTGDKARSHLPGAGRDEPEAGETTGAEQAAANRENDPPA
jgi:hypothetical protein